MRLLVPVEGRLLRWQGGQGRQEMTVPPGRTRYDLREEEAASG